MRIISARELLTLPPAAPSLRHELLVDEIQAGDFLCESYGVGARNEVTGAYASVRHVTVSGTRALALLELLVRNGVSPAALQDVVQDFIS